MAAVIPYKPLVYYSSTIAPTDDPAWTESPHLHCHNLTFGTSATMDQASFSWKYGTMKRESDFGSDAVEGYVAPLDLLGKYVRIDIPELFFNWYGYVLKDDADNGPEEDVGGLRYAYGNQSFLAVGLEWFLQREIVNFSIVDPALRIERAIGFNCGFGQRRGITYEDRGNKHAGALRFAADKANSQSWDGKAAIQYLFEQHNPRNAANDPAPISFRLDLEAEDFVSWFKPIVETEGLSVQAVIDDIAAQKRSLVNWLSVVDGGASGMLALLNVTSMATSDISLPGGLTLPENETQVALASVNGPNYRVKISRDLARHYDKVTVRGALRRSVFTISYASENFDGHWSDSLRDAYWAALGADPTENDEFRKSKKFEAVYQHFRIPAAWNGASNDGSSVPGPTAYACARQAQGSTSIIGAEPMAMPGLRLLHTMPIKAGLGYEDPTSPTGEDPNTAEEWQKMFGVIDISDDESGQWRFLDDLSDSDDPSKLTNYTISPLDSVAGFELRARGGMPHLLAKGIFDPDVYATNCTPQIDVRKARITAAGEWDAYCEGTYPVADPTNAPVQTLIVSIGDRARHDWMPAGTIYDCENGTLKTAAVAGALRDDRDLCVQVAQIAYQWYGEERAEVTIDITDIELPVRLGNLITTIGTGDTQKTVNAVVTQISFNFDQRTTSIMAGFAELNFAGLI